MNGNVPFLFFYFFCVYFKVHEEISESTMSTGAAPLRSAKLYFLVALGCEYSSVCVIEGTN